MQESFSQSDWAFQLDLMINPTRDQLVRHLDKLSCQEVNSNIALLLKSNLMKSAELKTIRESLNLTLQDVADQANVKLRTAQYWESGGWTVPEDVAEYLSELDRKVDLFVEAENKKIQSDKVLLVRCKSEPEVKEIAPFFTVATHAAALARLRRKLLERGVEVDMEYKSVKLPTDTI